MNLGCFLLLLNLAPFEINFKEQVEPILVKNCIECHNSSVTKGNLNLETLAFALKGGDGRQGDSFGETRGIATLFKNHRGRE